MVAVKGTQDARERLVAVATELFGERGYHQAGTEEIVRRSGVTRGSLYHHFADKKGYSGVGLYTRKKPSAVITGIGNAEFDAFLSAVNGDDSTAKVYAHRTLALDCCLFPGREALQAIAREKPGAVHALGDELAKRAGLRAEVVSDAL